MQLCADEGAAQDPAGGGTPAAHRKCCGVCIDYCIILGREELLFGDIYPKFEKVGQPGIFLELLEPFMLADHLRQLQPELLQVPKRSS